jgi:hypothetical protein
MAQRQEARARITPKTIKTCRAARMKRTSHPTPNPAGSAGVIPPVSRLSACESVTRYLRNLGDGRPVPPE